MVFNIFKLSKEWERENLVRLLPDKLFQQIIFRRFISYEAFFYICLRNSFCQPNKNRQNF